MAGTRVLSVRPLMVAVGLLICALACGVAAAGAAALPPPDYYGANVQPIFEKGFLPPSDWNGLIADMSADSLNVARMDAVWSWVEPKAPVGGVHTYDWNPASNPTHSMDKLVSLLASNNVRMLAVLSLPPSWAGASGVQMTPAHYDDFIAYASAFVERYGAGGTFWAANPQLPYLPVQQVEIWGEANSTNFWTGSSDPSAYASVLEPLHAALHLADPSIQVLASIGWENAASYVSQLYQLGLKGSIDGIGFHPYAPDVPSTIGLVQQMRSALVSAGDPNLPIFDTELGQPATTAAADATRAALLSLSGDALARSDCNAQSFDVYALTGSGTNAEPIDEGYMGILNDLTGAPDVTGQALIAASRRWQANPSGGLVLCGGGAPSSSSLLPLGLSLTHTSPTCVSATATYQGNPLQQAQLILRTDDGRVDPAGTSAAGTTQMCLQNGPAISSFTVYAEASSPVSAASFVTPDIARSATYSCPVSVAAPTATCTLVIPAPTGLASASSAGGGVGASTSIGALTNAFLACTDAQLVLTNITQHRTTVAISGLARATLAGKSVRIELLGTGRIVGRTVIAANGSFHLTTSLPAARLRAGARYVAIVGSSRSAALALEQRASMTSSVRGDRMVLNGHVTGPFRKGARVRIVVRVSCGRASTVATVRLTARGTFSASVRAPGSGQAIYEAAATVLRGSRAETVYTLPLSAG